MIKTLICDLINTYPELEEQQYTVPIEKVIKSGNYDKLLSYYNIDLKHLMDNNLLSKICKNANAIVLKHVIDNSVDLARMSI